ncbi:uncharacterized protein LOC130704351 [Daphnia carinata]|uniref:uncharacterized protein LOC130704351 n=1 Tax=Daphnia carinata TaxID=120202 RepID=UPI002579CF67|nr:uncharacterized protein LOC130704351 [Daphnia carinata]
MIRNYNNALAFASMGAQIDSPPGRGPYCFRIHGQIYHNTTAIGYQHEDNAPKYAQLYFIDSSQANEFRASNPANVRCDRFLMEQLDSLLRQCNPYAAMYKNMSQMAAEEDLLAEMEGRRPMEIGMIIRNDRRTQDERRYNSPTGEEIAVVFKSIDGAPPENRDIRGHLLIPRRGNRFILIDTQKPMCDPMTYPLLFPNGDNGWDQNMIHTNPAISDNYQNNESNCSQEDDMMDCEAQVLCDTPDNPVPDVVEPELEPEDALDIDPDAPVVRRVGHRSRITQCEFYSSRMSIRGYFNASLYGGPLTQQWIVDSYVKVEANRVKYLQTHQADLHVAQYNGLTDYLNTRAERENMTVGTSVILPSSFLGSPRAMKQGYQDAMAICGKFGKPTFFLTFTCNPKWPEITENIEAYQIPSNRPDIVSRVYHLKLKELIKDIQERQILGIIVARIHVIEFQKRGLPHAHLLMWIDENDVPTTEEDIDKTICAEIPDPEVNPILHKIVMSNMIHGPCGKEINRNSPCMDGDICTKSLPKPFAEETIINGNGYPTYRRRNNGRSYSLNNNSSSHRVGNSWVVPYNPYLH